MPLVFKVRKCISLQLARNATADMAEKLIVSVLCCLILCNMHMEQYDDKNRTSNAWQQISGSTCYVCEIFC